jgi:hypothetical protein
MTSTNNERRATEWQVTYEGPNGRFETTVRIGEVTAAEAAAFIEANYVDAKVFEVRAVERRDARLAEHPMFSASDLRYLRRKGYSDEQILAFWDRDHAAGKGPVHHKVTVTFEGIEFPNASEALQHANADPRMDTTILLGGKHYAVAKEMAQRIETEGIAFAYLCDHQMPDGTWRIVTVPVNQD